MSARRRSLLFLVVVLGLVAASLVAIALRPTVLGLDLQGGVEVVLKGKPTAESPVTPEAIARSADIIRSRVDRFGVAEPEIQTQNKTEIAISLPGAKDPDRVVRDLIKPAQLQLFDYGLNLVPLVGADGSQSESSPNLYNVAKYAGGVTPKNPDKGAASFYLFRTTPQHQLVAGPETERAVLLAESRGRVPKGTEVVTVPKGLVIVSTKQFLNPNKPDSPFQLQYVLLQDDPALRGRDISSAQQTFKQGLNGSEPVVGLQFTGDGRKKFATVTKELARRGRLATTDPNNPAFQSFAIVLDGLIITNPIIDFRDNPNGINSDRAQIEGNFSLGSARTLADQINSGALPITFEVTSLQQVSATLGKQSLRQGLIAGIIGLALVMVFLVGYYRLLGLVADLALLVYGVLFYAVIVLVPITLTLPGIAGMILTIGVAADANVVIFERIREEARAGRSARSAILGGYSKGITAIVDANVVTLATAAILFLFATSGVKGFAFTLFIGVLLSLFTAVLATRAVFGILADSKLFRNERLMGLRMREIHWKLDFVGKWKLWMAISFIPMLAGALVIGINGLNLGLDFTSGTRIHTSFLTGQPSEDAVRNVISGLGYDAKIQSTTDPATGKRGFQIQTKTLQPAQIGELKRALDTKLGGIDEASYGVDLVGPSFGRQVVKNAIYAILISFAVIILYLTFRFEYKLALPALLSVVHDVWLALSIYAITGREVTSATVAAILTILGYSLYDVVIVFDRIRENTKIMLRAPYREVVNRSVHETLTRSIITSLTTLLPVAVLFVFGGDTLKDFAFALLVGILSGGLSSIAIAAPIAALWKEREPAERKREARLRRREARRFVDSDADVVDIAALARAEAALEGQLERGEEPIGGLLPGEVGEEPEAEAEAELDQEPEALPAGDGQPPPADESAPDDEAADAAEPADAAAPAPPNGPPPPQRVRRHRQIQRKRPKR